MRFLVAGLGSIGERHIRNLLRMGHEISGVDPARRARANIVRSFGIDVYGTLPEAMKKNYDGAFICTPTVTHVKTALAFAEKGIDLFIEKPLSNDLSGIDRLKAAVARHKLVTMVACNTRFFPSFIKAASIIENGKIGKVLSARAEAGFYLPYWRPGTDYRAAYSARKELGGGVILDIIHEIDFLCRLFGKVDRVFCYCGKVSGLDISTEDLAEILLVFRKGTVAQVHLDYLQRTYRRHCKFIGDKGVVTWDYISQKVELFGVDARKSTVFEENINTEREQMFIDQATHFIECVKTRKKTVNDIGEAQGVLKVVMACHKSASIGKTVKV
ncbi:MAG: Gfo/Idh/MocA family oxidoreductase [Candidatus Omnitrophica bacterium]|nr:Gfo/Idh/MocA family oxidoreductase [Candidatus Omnitrophota bacterium]